MSPDLSFETFMRDVQDRLEYVSFEQAFKDAFESFCILLEAKDSSHIVDQKID